MEPYRLRTRYLAFCGRDLRAQHEDMVVLGSELVLYDRCGGREETSGTGGKACGYACKLRAGAMPIYMPCQPVHIRVIPPPYGMPCSYEIPSTYVFQYI